MPTVGSLAFRGVLVMAKPRRTTTERGYGAEHKAEKETWRPIVDAGQAWCAEVRCVVAEKGGTRWIPPGSPWHLAHAAGQLGYRGPAHRRCNIAEVNRRRRGEADATRSLWWRL